MKVTLYRDLPTERWQSMERYADELFRALRARECDVAAYVLPRPLPRLRGAANTLANYAWRSLAYPLAARAHQADLNHILDHSYAHLIYALDARRTLVTCHDLAPRALNEGRGVARWLWEHSVRAMWRAAHVITDSEFTRAEILRYTAYPGERISVVPLAVGAEFFEPCDADVRAHHQLGDRKIILHVGSCAPRKNIETILHALAARADGVVVQIGGRFTAAHTALIAALGLRARTLQIPAVDETELRAWYRAADVFVFPSLYEGFGLPILEAMASGAPVICAHATALPEIARDAALMGEPRNATQLARNLARVLDDPALAHDLRARGVARARQFTWERTARAMLAVYEKIAQ